MENDIAGLSLKENTKDKAWPVVQEGSTTITGFENCLMGCFLVASVVRFEAMHMTMVNL